mgnify:CR=1 FL=1|jgi:hypothetical protein|tara:strand:+ start:226 stop:2340 length:2115 start_codon:yes stop_codon:yes gene_type:complete
MPEEVLFNQESATEGSDKDGHAIGAGRVLVIASQTAMLYRDSTYVKSVDLADKPARQMFIIDLIEEEGAMKSRVAQALKISRQTIDNYLDIKKHFGTEGFVRGYSVSQTKSKRKQREIHAKERPSGNKAELVAELRKKEREKRERQKRNLDFSFEGVGKSGRIEKEDQVFSECHDWKESRYAGVCGYLVTMITGWKWLELVMGHFGNAYKICMVFLLMAAGNIRSIEQLKNIRLGEAGTLLGLRKLPSLPGIWRWFYAAASEKLSGVLLRDYFGRQIRAGLVSMWIWFTDGHLLPYTGKQKVHHSYNTQRQMVVPGRTNMVSCDGSGRIVDFEIQEGKGDLRGHIKALGHKWKGEVEQLPVMVFDREGYGSEFFSGLVQDGIEFVTWEKYADAKVLAGIDDDKFEAHFEFNSKRYSIFEDEKVFKYQLEDPERNKAEKGKEHEYVLRQIFIWNKTSNRRVSGLAWGLSLNSEECAKAILSRWGASENTFKHLSDRHPLHYHPGFELVESENQEIANPEVKEKERLIKAAKMQLGKLYKKLAKTPESVNKDGEVRKNSKREQLTEQIKVGESRLDALNKEKQGLPERVDVSTLENYQSFKKIDDEGKNLFDFVTTSVWNARKQMIDWLRPYYNRENEIVDLFYAITDCRGWIKSTETEVIFRLEPLQQPKRRAAQTQLCRKLTGLGAQTSSGKWLTVEVGNSPLS